MILSKDFQRVLNKLEATIVTLLSKLSFELPKDVAFQVLVIMFEGPQPYLPCHCCILDMSLVLEEVRVLIPMKFFVA